jgi:hypothetical protein
MSNYAPLYVSQETTAIWVVDEAGRIVAEKKIATCPDAIASGLTKRLRFTKRAEIPVQPKSFASSKFPSGILGLTLPFAWFPAMLFA